MIAQKQSNPRICFLILSSVYEPWKSLYEAGPRQTWVKDWKHNPQTFFFTYSGIPRKFTELAKLHNFILRRQTFLKFWTSKKDLPDASFNGPDKILVNIDERWDTMTLKFLSAAKLILDTFEFDFLVKTNTTTYVNQSALMSAINCKPDYMGVPSKNGRFAVGWGQIYSRTAIYKATELYRSANIGNVFFEDEAIGALMSELGYGLVPTSSNIIKNLEEVESGKNNSDKVFTRLYYKLGKKRNDDILFASFHKHFKSQSTKY